MIWTIDSTHSYVSFAIRVLGVSTTKGRFNAPRGLLSLDEQNPASSWVEVEVDAASIDTHNRLRDAHLRSAAFFAVKQYATIAFKSTKVEHVAGQDYKVMGNLTLLGVTKPVTFDVTRPERSDRADCRGTGVLRPLPRRPPPGRGRAMHGPPEQPHTLVLRASGRAREHVQARARHDREARSAGGARASDQIRRVHLTAPHRHADARRAARTPGFAAQDGAAKRSDGAPRPQAAY